MSENNLIASILIKCKPFHCVNKVVVFEIVRENERPHCPECGYIYDGIKCDVCKYEFGKEKGA